MSYLTIGLAILAAVFLFLLVRSRKLSIDNFRLVKMYWRRGDELDPTQPQLDLSTEMVHLKKLSEFIQDAKKKRRHWWSSDPAHIWRIVVYQLEISPHYTSGLHQSPEGGGADWCVLEDYMARIRADLRLDEDVFSVFLGMYPCGYPGWSFNCLVQIQDWTHIQRIKRFLADWPAYGKCYDSSFAALNSIDKNTGKRRVDMLRGSEEDVRDVYKTVFLDWVAPEEPKEETVAG